MSTDIESLAVNFNVDLSDFDKKMNSAEKQIKTLGKDFEATGKSIAKSFASSISSAVDKLNSTMKGLNKSQESTGTGFSDIAENISKVVENANSFSDLIKSITEVSDSTKTITTVMASMTTSSESAAISMDGFTVASESTEVAMESTTVATEGASVAMEGLQAASGIIGIAIAGIIAIVNLITSLSKPSEAVQKLRDEADALADTIKKDQEAYDKASDSISDNSAAASGLTDQLTTLNSKENKTNADKQKMVALVGQLNKLYPDLGLSIDEATGALNMNNQELKDSIGNMKTQAEMTAASDAYTKALEDQAEAKRKLAEAQRINDKTAIKEDTDSLNEASDAITFYSNTIDKLANTTAWDKLTSSQKAYYRNMGLTKDEYNESASAISTYTQDQINNMESMGYTYDDLKTKNSDALDKILSDWQDNQDQMKQLLDDRVDMTQNAFSKIDTSADNVSYNKMLDNLKYNSKKVTDYTNNLSMLEGTNLDKGFLQKLKDMGPEAADAVQNLANKVNKAKKAGKDSFDFSDLNAAYKSGGEAAANSVFGTSVSTGTNGKSSKSDFSDKTSKEGKTQNAGAIVINDTSTAMKDQITNSGIYGIGASLMSSFNDGMESMRGPILTKVGTLLDSIVTKLTGIAFVVKVDPQKVKIGKHANGGIRYHAEGGVTDGPTVMDIMGESGAEALLPLESNTGWMDKIADRVAAKMGSLQVDFTVNTPVNLDGAAIAASQTKQTKILNLQTGAAVMGGI